jgi:hypothetical protein
MRVSAGTEIEFPWTDAQHTLLPMMTALFINGLEPDGGLARYDAEAMLPQPAAPQRARARIFRVPICDPVPEPPARAEQPACEISCSRNTLEHCLSSTEDAIGGHTAIRTLIRGLSHHFNNVMMGMWGNATLIRLQVSDDDPLHEHMVQMERLIQSGSFLINMVLGYLGERRSMEKRVRLNQLIQEIKQAVRVNEGQDATYDFEALLKWASRVQNPRIVAGSTARILDVLFRGIQSHCGDTGIETGGHNVKIRARLEIINALVTKGLEMTLQVHQFAGNLSPKKRRIRSSALLDPQLA